MTLYKYSMLAYALKYLALGFSIIPLKQNKRPYLFSWTDYQERKPTEKEVREWWGPNKWPDANIGIITGEISGIIVLDVESSEGLVAAEAAFGGDIPYTIVQNTGKPNGQHYIFRHPGGGKKYPNWAKKIKDCDFRGDGGYIMVAPSVHPSGKLYKWDDIIPLEQGLDEMADAPKELLDICNEVDKGSAGVTSKNPEGWVNDLLFYGVDQGERNEKITKLAGYYFNKFNWPEDRVFDRLVAFNLEKCRPPLSRYEIEKTVHSISKHHMTEKLTASEISGIEGGGQLVKLNYPDGNVMYRFHLKESDTKSESIELSIKELGSPRLFREKLAQKTDRLMPLKKQAEWDEYVNMLLKNVISKYCGLDESPLGKIVEVLEGEIYSPRVSSKYSEIKRRALIVTYDGMIKLTLKGLDDTLRRFGDFEFNRKELVQHLRTLGFKNKQINTGKVHGNIRGWITNIVEFKKRIAKIIKESQIEIDDTAEFDIEEEAQTIM